MSQGTGVGSGEEHGVAVAEEAEALTDGGGIGRENEVAPARLAWGREGAHQHEKGGAWEVKVGEEGVYDFEIVRWVDEDAGATSPRNEVSMVRGSNALQHARGGGANGDYAAAFGFGLVYRSGGLFGNRKSFFVHAVLGEVFDLYRSEGPQADMQRYVLNVDAVFLQGFQELWGEVESGCGRGNRTFFHGENGLVTFQVGFQGGRGVPLDVGREGDFAQFIEAIQNV